MATLNIFLGSFGANIPTILAFVLIIAIIVAVKSSKSEDYSPAEDWQNNKVINITLNGGIIGLLADSPQRTLNRRIKKENADGWRVVQIIPADSGNLFLAIFRLILLLLTLFIFTTANGYYVVMERRKSANIRKVKNKISDTITTKSNLETTINDKLQGKINEETEKFDSRFEKLKKSLKDDEIIIEIKKTNKLKVIKKVQLEMDKDLHISNSYIIRYKNNILKSP